MSDFVLDILSLAFLAQMLRITVPYAMAALGGVMSERSGVINIALEGILLAGAFAGAVAEEKAKYSWDRMAEAIEDLASHERMLDG